MPRLYVQVSVVDVEPHGCLGLLQMVDVPLLTVESRVLHLWDDVRDEAPTIELLVSVDAVRENTNPGNRTVYPQGHRAAAALTCILSFVSIPSFGRVPLAFRLKDWRGPSFCGAPAMATLVSSPC